jgi:guanylate kinase
MEGKLVIFSAPSGSGKTTLVNHLLETNLALDFSVSATSRKPRPGEINGKNYYFISPSEFREKINNNEFIEWEEVYEDHYYGTLKSEIERIWADGKHVIFDVDVIGGLNLKKEFGNRALSIFVSVPSLRVLEERLRIRSTETEQKILQRLKKAREEMTYANQFDVILVNDDLCASVEAAVKVVKSFLEEDDV